MSQLISSPTLLLCLTAAALCGCGGSSSKRSGSAAAGATSAATTAATTSTGGVGGASAPVPLAGPTAPAFAQPPALGAVTPNQGTLLGGVAVTISGSNFGTAPLVVLFGDRAVDAVPVSDTRIDVIAPAGPAAGTVDLRLATAQGLASLPGAWTWTPPSPTLGFAPPVGHHEIGVGGTLITLTVEGLAAISSAATVEFGSLPAASLARVDSRTLLAEVPDALPPGPLDVVLTDGALRLVAPGFLVQGRLAWGDLVVNEICPQPGGIDNNGDGQGDSKADEFVEIVNTTNQWVDLSFLTVRDENTERHRFVNPTALPPGGAIVVFGGGTPTGFLGAFQSGQAQAATWNELALNNTADTVELRTLPGINPSGLGETIFRVDYSAPPTGASLINRVDGGRINGSAAAPATSADYEDHTVQGPTGTSPGRRRNGAPF